MNRKKKEQKTFLGKCFLRQDFEKEEFIRTGNETGEENQSVLELLRRGKAICDGCVRQGKGRNMCFQYTMSR